MDPLPLIRTSLLNDPELTTLHLLEIIFSQYL